METYFKLVLLMKVCISPIRTQKISKAPNSFQEQTTKLNSSKTKRSKLNIPVGLILSTTTVLGFHNPSTAYIRPVTFDECHSRPLHFIRIELLGRRELSIQCGDAGHEFRTVVFPEFTSNKNAVEALCTVGPEVIFQHFSSLTEELNEREIAPLLPDSLALSSYRSDQVADRLWGLRSLAFIYNGRYPDIQTAFERGIREIHSELCL